MYKNKYGVIICAMLCASMLFSSIKTAVALPDAYEQNDSQSTASNLGTLSANFAESLTIDAAGDGDYYNFSLAAGDAVFVRAVVIDSGLTFYMFVYGPDGEMVDGGSADISNIINASVVATIAGSY
jgi:hypothetical protein